MALDSTSSALLPEPRRVPGRGPAIGLVPGAGAPLEFAGPGRDPEVFLARLGQELPVALGERGIASEPPVRLVVEPDGGISVLPPDHPWRVAIERLLAERPDLAADLVGAEKAERLRQRMAAATSAWAGPVQASAALRAASHGRILGCLRVLDSYRFAVALSESGIAAQFIDRNGDAAPLPSFG